MNAREYQAQRLSTREKIGQCLPFSKTFGEFILKCWNFQMTFSVAKNMDVNEKNIQEEFEDT
jgi:hypothetical protein